MPETGLLTSVHWAWDGTELAVPGALDATAIVVDNPGSLTIGSTVWIGGSGPYTLLSVDPDTGDATVSPALIEDYEQGEPVVPDTGGVPGRIWLAEVVLPDADEPIKVVLTNTDLLSMPEGEYIPPKAIRLTDDLAHVVDLPNATPTLDGGFLAAGTLPYTPPPQPTEAPSASPAPTVLPVVRGLQVVVAPQPVYTTLTYEVSTNPAFTNVVKTLTTEDNSVFLLDLPSATDLYVRVTASNVVGAAAPSAPVGPFRTILLEATDVGDFTITAKKFNTSTHVLY